MFTHYSLEPVNMLLYVAKGTLQMWLRLETQRFSWIIRKPNHMSPSNWKAGRLVRKIQWGKKTQERWDRKMTQLLLRTWKPQNAGGSASWGCFLAGCQPARKLVLGCSFLQSQVTTVCQQHQCARLQTLPESLQKGTRRSNTLGLAWWDLLWTSDLQIKHLCVPRC